MSENKNGHHGSNGFLWGLLIGAFLATLLTSKRGRRILRDFAELGLELFDDFIDRETGKNTTKPQEVVLDEKEESFEDAASDIESEITESEISPQTDQDQTAESKDLKNNGNGHVKKRLFRGIRRNK